MDIKLLLENQLVIMHVLTNVLNLTAFEPDPLNEQIRKTRKRLDHWGGSDGESH